MLEAHPFKVFVFIGANQMKLPRNTVVSMQALGEKAKYIEIEGSGPNALDFHIAYYVGELAASDSKGSYYVVSRDKGFDPLIRHLKDRNVRIRRVKDLAEIPNLRIPEKTKKSEMIDLIVKNLADRGHARPRKVKTLQNTIANIISDKLNDGELAALVAELRKRKFIRVEHGNVKYTLPR